jgi:hypothetical protein
MKWKVIIYKWNSNKQKYDIIAQFKVKTFWDAKAIQSILCLDDNRTYTATINEIL